jgi:hypothetical protein
VSGPERPPPPFLRLLLVGFWLLPAAVATLGMRLVPSRLNPDLTVIEIFAAQLLIWLPWALWSQVIVAVGERVPLEKGTALRSLAAHALLSPIVIVLQILAIWGATVRFGMNEPRGLESMIIIGIRQYADLLMVVYWAVVGAHASIRWHERWQEQNIVAARLREDVANASLQALRAQVNPHFLFNALNAVVTLIGRDPTQAREMLVRISELLRATLTAGDTQETTLAQEVELTARYLEIEQVRFADRLSVEWEIDSQLSSRMVPAFALQPLVENALRHAMGQRRSPGVVRIIARRVAAGLELVVRDDGPDGPPPANPSTGRGAGVALKNLRARLERLYGSAASLSLKPRTEGGMDAVVFIPSSES